MKIGLKAILGITGMSLLAVGVAVDGGVFNFANIALRMSRATGTSVVLNNSNAPTLSGGAATRVDDKSITWEYSNCASYASGHVKINAGGYFGISSSSIYGYTGIDGLTVNFTNGGSGELWLLTSYNGTTWNEMKEFKDTDNGVFTTVADNWRYIRFFNYAPDNSQISITSVSFEYTCTGISNSDDVDGTSDINNVIAVENVDYEVETTDFSPLTPDSTKALKFIKKTSGTVIKLGFGRTYTCAELVDKKIEFDMKSSVFNSYGKTLELVDDTGTKVSNTSSVNSNSHSAYKYTSLGNDWYHIEVPTSALFNFISGFHDDGEADPKKADKDKPAKNLASEVVAGIKINAGGCVIDNLRVGSTSCELGSFNNGTSFTAGPSFYWFKISYVGKLRSCTMSFDDPTIAEQVPTDDSHILNGSPFYIKGLLAGRTVTVTATVVSGYNAQFTYQISRTLTVN